jgi:hypothetical protein
VLDEGERWRLYTSGQKRSLQLFGADRTRAQEPLVLGFQCIRVH